MSTTVLRLPGVSFPVGNLDAYIYRINQIPMLTADEESSLSLRFHQVHDIQSAQKLVLAHLRFVVKVAKEYLGYGLALADLIQEGNIGLMKAVKRFDPARGVRLVTFALYWIKAEIHEFVLKNYRMVKVATTKAQRKLFFNLRRLKPRQGWMSQEESQAIATELKVGLPAVREMEGRLSFSEASYDGFSEEADSETVAPASYLADAQSNPEAICEEEQWEGYAHARFAEAFQELDERGQTILRERWLQPEKVKLQTLADRYGLTAERIRQLEKEAMQFLRKRIGVHGA